MAELVQSCVIEHVSERDNKQAGALVKNYSSEQMLRLVNILTQDNRNESLKKS